MFVRGLSHGSYRFRIESESVDESVQESPGRQTGVSPYVHLLTRQTVWKDAPESTGLLYTALRDPPPPETAPPGPVDECKGVVASESECEPKREVRTPNEELVYKRL